MALDEYVYSSVFLADAANAAKDYYATPLGTGEYQPDAVVYTPSSAGAVAIDGTNYRTITLTSGGVTIATITTFTGGTAFVAGTPISATIAGLASCTGNTDAVKIATTYAGTGGAANGTLQIRWVKVRA